MNHRDANIVKVMREKGHSVIDIAYALACDAWTVRSCINREYAPTAGKARIGDRQEKFFPHTGNGNSKAGVTYFGEDEETNSQQLPCYYSEPEMYAIAIQEVENRLKEEIDSLSIERLLWLL